MNEFGLLLKRLSNSFFPVFVMGVFMVFSMSLLSEATENSSRFGRMHLALVIVNVIGLIVLVGLITVNFIQLLRQYRNRTLGSRLTTRLVLVFVMLSVAPVTVVFYFSIGFLQRGIDSWFDVRMEKALNDALDLSRTSLDLKMRELLNRTRHMASELSEFPGSTPILLLNDMRIKNDATELTLFSGGGQVLATSNVEASVFIPQLPSEWLVREVMDKQSYTGLSPVKGMGLQVRVAVLLPTQKAEYQPLILYALYPISDRISDLANSVELSYGQYKQIIFLREPLKDIFIITLSLVLLLSVLTAIWAAFYSAQRLVAPIRLLSLGTRAVAAGDYDKRLPEVSNDELGELVKSFSDMTGKLALARDQANLSQEQVEQERAYLQAVLGRLSTGVITLDEQMNLRVANAAASQVLEVELGKLLGQPLRHLSQLAEYLEPFVERVLERLASSNQEWREEIQLKQKTGVKILICQGVRLRSEHLEHSGFVIVFDDVSTFIKTQRDAAWGDVARRLAHEIKNPLTPIQLSAERLKRKLMGNLDSDGADLLERCTHTIVQQVQTMKQLVIAFSEYARVPKIELQPMYVDQVVKEVLDLYVDEESNIAFRSNLSSDHPQVSADAGRMRQLLHNLIKNAIESTVDVEQPVIEISVKRIPFQHGTGVELKVIDNGRGIPEAILTSLFEPHTTTKSQGGGLGLTVVHRIVEEHNGKMYAENNDGPGATFVVQIPAIDNPKSEPGDWLVQAT